MAITPFDDVEKTSIKAQLQDDNGVAVVIGQKTMANSLPIAIASDQPAVPITDIYDITNPPTAYALRANKVITSGSVYNTSDALTSDISITDFIFGGRGAGQASLFSCDPASTTLLPNGGFNSSGDVSAWTNAGIGNSALGSWSYATDQFTMGTGSAKFTFTTSANNDYPAIKYTWGTAQNLTAWRYIKADVRVTVAAGGTQTRTVQMILTDANGITRTYQISGSTTTAPFNTEQWQTLTAEIEAPNASSGNFDIYNVSSITLKLLDGGNKAGSIWWDNVRFVEARTLLQRIYNFGNFTNQILLNPAEAYSSGQNICIEVRNNDASAAEFTAVAKGIVR